MCGCDQRRGALRAGLVAIVLALTAGCAGAALEPTTVPTFAAPALQPGPAAGQASYAGVLPDDCAGLLTPSDLEALLGMPLGSVAVATTAGIPEPSVGRTERVACSYTGTAGGPARGRRLLGLGAAAYTDADAAARQWRINVGAEDGTRRDVPIGSASAVLIERRTEAVLMVVHGGSTITVLLPELRLPGNRSRADALVDLALRVLPAVASPASRGTPAPEPSVSAGSQS